MSDESTDGWPDEVRKRLEAYAERTGASLEDVTSDFVTYLVSDFGIEDSADEDEDLIQDLSEGFFMETRRARAGGSSTEYVGHFVGVAAKWNDRREKSRARLCKAYQNNADAIIESGDVGVFSSKDGKWSIQTKNGLVDTEEEVVEGQLPKDSFRCGEILLGMLVKNPASSNCGKPFPCYDATRYIYFLGNEKSAFEDDIRLLRISANPEDEITIGLPCKFQGRPIREDASDGWDDVVEVWDDWTDNITYTDEFVDPEVRRDLRAERYWVSEDFHSHYVELDELTEAYESGKQTLSSGDGHFGPVVLTKGFVARMSTEGQRSEHDQTGRNFSMDLSSMALQQAHGDERAEVRLWISGACHDLTHPFEFSDEAGWVEYAERSVVLVCGRIGLRAVGDHYVPKMNVMGVYAIPNRARRRQSGGDTGLSQFD